jgi:hypothetical protein
VERRIGDVEIRRYEPYVVAETVVDGPLERAGNRGFRVLAGYIFGANETSSGDSTKLAMTTPVTQERVGEEYRVRFMMPSGYNVDDLPTPKDARVRIEPIGSRRLGAIRYSGRWSGSAFERQLARLEETLGKGGFEPVGEAIWARYDPPWKPWFLRRNEVLIAVDAPAKEQPST